MQFITSMGKPVLILTLFSAGCLLSLAAAAEALSTEQKSAGPFSAEVVAKVVPGLGLPLANNQLAGLRGGFETVNNDMQLSGSVANNSAVNVASGNNYIAGGSFTNMTGLPITIQNSGSNVLIQNATIVNVQFQ